MNVKEFYKEMYGEEAPQCVIVEQMQNIFDFAEAYAQHKVESLKLNKHDVSNSVCNHKWVNGAKNKGEDIWFKCEICGEESSDW